MTPQQIRERWERMKHARHIQLHNAQQEKENRKGIYVPTPEYDAVVREAWKVERKELELLDQIRVGNLSARV